MDSINFILEEDRDEPGVQYVYACVNSRVVSSLVLDKSERAALARQLLRSIDRDYAAEIVMEFTGD